MRPLRLAMTAFGPFAETEHVDFESLADLGLFAVAGQNGAGKTTIFDGLYFALYGSLPGRRATYNRLRSDHARAAVETRVELEFVAHGEHWRIERSPKQMRPKRRGTGETERQQHATLSRVTAGVVETVANRLNDVNSRCRDLVGLTGPQFERVALLPQGEFSRLLRESGTERRSLLRTLFSSDIFSDATNLLVDDAAELDRNHQLIEASLDDRATRIVEAVAALAPLPEDADTASVIRALDSYESTVLAARTARVDELRRRANEHAAAVQHATELTARIQRRDHARAALERHHVDEPQIRSDLDRLSRARAAVPVVDIANVARRQRAGLESARSDVAELHGVVQPLLERVAPQSALPGDIDAIESLSRSIGERASELAAWASALDEADRLDSLVRDLVEAEQKLEREVKDCATQTAALVGQRDELENEITRFRTIVSATASDDDIAMATERLAQHERLAELERTVDELGKIRHAVAAEREALNEQLGHAETARNHQVECNDTAETAATALAALVERRSARIAFDGLRQQLSRARHGLLEAQSTHDRHFDAFVGGMSSQLAELLVDGEPCSVCGSGSHPAPATRSATAVTQHDLELARDAVDDRRRRVTDIETELEQLTRDHHDLATASIDALDHEIAEAKHRALASEAAANDAARVVANLDRLRLSTSSLDARFNEVGEQLATADRARHQLIGALGDDIRRSRSEVAEHLSQCHESRSKGERAQRELVALERTLTETANAIDRAATAERNARDQRAAICAEADARRRDHAQATDVVASVRSGSTTEPRVEHERVLYTLHILDRLRTALAREASSDDATRRAELVLDEKLGPSPFDSVDAALAAHTDPATIEALEASTVQWTARRDQLLGELRALDDVPDIGPDVDALTETMVEAEATWQSAHRDLASDLEICRRARSEITAIQSERDALEQSSVDARRRERIAALVKGDNDHNTSLENWVLAAHLRDVVELANVRLASSTQQRFQLCVLDEGEHRRGRWGLELAVEDTVTGTRRPTAGLSGGELFQASLALALGLADAVMNQSSGTQIDALFIDEGFGSLDENSIERVIDLLDGVRSRGAMVGVISHVGALLDALPRGLTVVSKADGSGSTIRQAPRAA